MVELPQYDVAEPVIQAESVAPVVQLAIVAPVPVAPVVPQPPVGYDIENDPEIEIIFSSVDIVAPVPVALEPVEPVAPVVQVEAIPVAPVVPQPPVRYDIENDPEIEIIYSKVGPRYQIPSDYRRRARHLKREKR